MPSVVVNREHPPSNLATIVKAKDGTPVARWAEDESKLENVLGSLIKSGDMPGGHTELSGTLPRDPTKSYPDLALFSEVELQGAGRERLWTGTIRQEPEDGERQTIEVKAVGDKQFLEDEEDVVGPGFIDCDLSKWGEISTSILLQWLGEEKNRFGSAVNPDTSGQPALTLAVTEPWPSGARAGAMYDSGGVDIQQVFYDRKQLAGVGSFKFAARLLPADSLAASVDVDAGILSEARTAGELAGEGGRFVEFEMSNDEAKSGTSTETVDAWSNIRVLGHSEVGLYGHWPNVGYLAKQMIPFIVEGSGLTTKDELLEDDEFIIPQAWFSDPATRMSKLVEVTKYGLLDWFVFNDRILQYRKPRTFGRNWRLSPGSGTPKNAGQDANRVWDRLTVTWSDVDRTTKRAQVGPLTDERNAAVAAGRPRGKLLALNGVCTEALAVQTGARFLEEAQNLAQSGEAIISGYCQDEYGIWWPAAYVQPGDWAADPGTQNYRKITNVNYAHDSKSASVTLGAPPQGQEALEARFNARLIELGFGS